jgi:BolA protein
MNIKTDILKIYDHSIFHNRLKNNLTHLKIVIVSDDFKNHSIINRHRMIFKILDQYVEKKIYSITLYTYTCFEWQNKKNDAKDISLCFKKNNIL